MVSEEQDTAIGRDNFVSTNGKHYCSLTQDFIMQPYPSSVVAIIHCIGHTQIRCVRKHLYSEASE